MSRNLGRTKLRRRRRQEDPMREFDRLPPLLRMWLADAALPWRPRSVRRAFDRALAQTGDPSRAVQELERLEAAQLSKAGAPGADLAGVLKRTRTPHAAPASPAGRDRPAP